MNKTKIIGGVDVSECIHIDYWEHCNCCNDLIKTINPKVTKCLIEKELRCDTYSNCYFKQLARVKEENEKLKTKLIQKNEVDTFFNTPIEGWDNDPCKVCTYKQNYQAKEQECEELKKATVTLAEGLNFQQKRADKLEQALDEIENYCDEQNLKYDTTACDILGIINRLKDDEQ